MTGFHAYCVDPWLALFQTTCPVCRIDVSQVRVTIEQIRRIENATADLRRNANRLVNRFFLFQAGIFFFAQWDLPSEHNIFVLSLSLIASFRLAYAFPLISLDLQHMYDEIDSIKAIDYRVARYFRIWRLCLVTCFISLAIGFAVVLPIALVTKSSPAFYCKICFAVMLGTYTMQSWTFCLAKTNKRCGFFSSYEDDWIFPSYYHYHYFYFFFTFHTFSYEN